MNTARSPLLLCSLGNAPAVFAKTRHNAGHTMLEMYRTRLAFPDMRFKKTWRGSISTSDGVTLFRSKEYMNRSGHAVKAALNGYRQEHPDGMFCVMHDDMEVELGAIKLRPSGKGKGHNGIRSCRNLLGTDEFNRIQVGIGRPQSKDPGVVQDHCLGDFTEEEMKTLEGVVLPKLLKLVHELQTRSADV